MSRHRSMSPPRVLVEGRWRLRHAEQHDEPRPLPVRRERESGCRCAIDDLRPDTAWSPKLPDGWSYLDNTRTFAGIRKVRLLAGGPGEAQVLVSGGGPGLPLPAPVTPTPLFAQDPTVTVQLVNENARCWRATFLSARRNTGQTFRARLH